MYEQMESSEAADLRIHGARNWFSTSERSNTLDYGTDFWYYNDMNKRNIRTYREIYEKPLRSDIPWTDIESLFTALGADISEGSGSRVRVELNGVRAVFHRPHPEKETDRGAVKAVQQFLNNAGIKI